ASRFKQVLTEYQKAPAVTRDRMYLDTMQQIFTNTTKVMVDAKTGNNLIYLPLDKLIAQSDADAAKQAAASLPPPTPLSSSSSTPDVGAQIDSSRSRDPVDLRSREGR
ncbi:MAG TPA: protease modulator HflK, partial [Herbaspirillum sp.]|nr:protease modulator HflK [Herbaspirillum sp.]